MKKTLSARTTLTAERIARLADQGKDVSGFFKGPGRMVRPQVQEAKPDLPPPIQRVNVDITLGMVQELDNAARELNVSRQAVIKTLVRQALDQHYLAQSARKR